MWVLLVTDAWRPQVNGVVRSLERMVELAPTLGVTVETLTPEGFRQFALPSYPDIRAACPAWGEVSRRVAQSRADHIHIATEGPLGWLARAACLQQKCIFSTSYHTRFPQYIAARWPVPERWSYALLRRFHAASAGVMVSTPAVKSELEANGFTKTLPWGRGVDSTLFRPDNRQVLDLPRPIFLTVARVAVEKNLEAFLSLPLPGSKVVVGEGPQRAALMAAYPDAVFLGLKQGIELAEIYASADVFVFPSLTDTYGIVLLEAAASGLPVAAFPVQGPVDVFGDSGAAALDDDLQKAAMAALRIPRETAVSFARTRSWHDSAQQFYGHMARLSGHQLPQPLKPASEAANAALTEPVRPTSAAA